MANYNRPVFGNRYSDGLRPVDSYEAGKSPCGIYNMAGNASEWVADWHDEQYYAASPESNPDGPARGAQRVIRGGSFGSEAVLLKAASRDSDVSVSKGPFVGIRCARDTF
ncbi:MAG: hypothetical protein C4293_06110 [Nitrospiraceae bacterium]